MSGTRVLRGDRGRLSGTTGVPFDDRIDRSGGPDACWPWLGATRDGGYGSWWDPSLRRLVPSHREAARRAGIPIDGLMVLHRCDNPPCCNPAHLSAGTHVENMADMVAKGRSLRGQANPQFRHGRDVGKRQRLPREPATHCPHGHPFDEANTYQRPSGGRHCRICQDAARRRYRARTGRR